MNFPLVSKFNVYNKPKWNWPKFWQTWQLKVLVFYQTRYEEQVFLFKILFNPFPFASFLVITYQLNRSPASPTVCLFIFLRRRLSRHSLRIQILSNFRPIRKALLTEPKQRWRHFRISLLLLASLYVQDIYRTAHITIRDLYLSCVVNFQYYSSLNHNITG